MPPNHLETHAFIYPGRPCTSPESTYTSHSISILHLEYFKLLPTGRLQLLTYDPHNHSDTQNAFDPSHHPHAQQGILVTVSAGYDAITTLFDNMNGEYWGCINTLTTFVTTHSSSILGIDLDFEIYPAWPRELFTSFVGFCTDLGHHLHAHKKLLSICAPSWGGPPFHPSPRNFDLSVLGALECVDMLVLMTYDAQDLTSLTPENGEPTPVTPRSWLRGFVGYALTQLPPHKILVGIPSYGYHRKGDKTRLLTRDQILEIAPGVVEESVRELDGMELVLRMNKHQKWRFGRGADEAIVMNDERSVRAKVDALVGLPVRGIAVWHLGGGNPWIE
ncbi:hypothetical protein SAICODRAFT_4345 [Saitoella complicata NRRL Y-17804]|uniref:Chitinase domain-containing protein 1 n=1 Tax=Saitoella complicata (strain BCRC 22490 / CBS 7301 / JCM 7358 / NBRC 10748 / NRRL Y-17804) TaxID=698492 RepID=A0A0E9NDW6_SAICN|nr:uncharacterized protein SAICODRAFT_4345 [Saitoella complicata NRRL Y-17804]ODQ56148.1 hypothetical protein SAICODRAFT_4345 [Saitoella complicata NRRL Y-17804]GAO47891.1 hypothetical protein G7K_2087-t1 [Saitoella complicata NRRL Y-17804]